MAKLSSANVIQLPVIQEPVLTTSKGPLGLSDNLSVQDSFWQSEEPITANVLFPHSCPLSSCLHPPMHLCALLPRSPFLRPKETILALPEPSDQHCGSPKLLLAQALHKVETFGLGAFVLAHDCHRSVVKASQVNPGDKFGRIVASIAGIDAIAFCLAALVISPLTELMRKASCQGNNQCA